METARKPVKKRQSKGSGFKPTKAMVRARFLLQRACPPAIVKNLHPKDDNLREYVAPFPVTQVKKWATDVAGFWQWFLTPCDYEPKFMEAKELALKFYVEVLKMSHYDEEGAVDKRILDAKLKIADRLVGSKEDRSVNVNVNQATQNLNTGSDAAPRLPAAYRRNPELLAGKISQLKESRQEKEAFIEGEIVCNTTP